MTEKNGYKINKKDDPAFVRMENYVNQMDIYNTKC